MRSMPPFLPPMFVALVLCCASSGLGQSPHTQHTLALDNPDQWASADLSQFDWLTGRWVGEGLGGECEEVFLPALGDSKLGTFRLIRDGHLFFSEFFSFAKEEGGTVLKLKHFHPDMTGWEEKGNVISFRLIKVEDRAAYFHGLTYQLADDGTLQVWVAMRNAQSGELSEVPFILQRTSL